MIYYTATYDPADDKLRLSATSRLDQETYARVKAAGFGWAPKQGVFFAVWSPAREDLLVELAGEIGDEDTSLVDRAEARADRFEDYRDKRASDAESARKAVSAIADSIPLGQPILVGHHSQRHAEHDAARIENGMRKAVNLWKTSTYWQGRAFAARAHARYTERPDVRARRIKKLEAEQRSHERDTAKLTKSLALWSKLHEPDGLRRKDGQPTTFLWRATMLAELQYRYKLLDELKAGTTSPEQAQQQVVDALTAALAREKRWGEHLGNRIAYERAMLGEAGGTVADRTKPEKGGGCKCWVGVGQWLYIQKVNKVSVTVLDNWGNGGRDFTRTVPFDRLKAIMNKADVDAARAAGRLVDTESGRGFIVRDEMPKAPRAEREPSAEAQPFEAMAETLKAGTKAVVVDQLFPTPRELAARMVELADIKPGDRVLEPSAGTGNILRAIHHAIGTRAHVVAVEANKELTESLPRKLAGEIRCGDFLAQTQAQLGGEFRAIVMNPPFAGAQDVAHIEYARELLAPGGRLVALCADGPRQRAKLQPLATTWEELPEETFAAQGTHVRTVLLTIDN